MIVVINVLLTLVRKIVFEYIQMFLFLTILSLHVTLSSNKGFNVFEKSLWTDIIFSLNYCDIFFACFSKGYKIVSHLAKLHLFTSLLFCRKLSWSLDIFIILQALRNWIRAYVTYSKWYILQIAVYTCLLFNKYIHKAHFQFPQYVKQF